MTHHCLKALPSKSSSINKWPRNYGSYLASSGIVLGFGVVFALTMNAITWLGRRYLHESSDTQMLMTAKKSVKTGLVASAVVSSCKFDLWKIISRFGDLYSIGYYAATILNSVRLTHLYGFAGLWWFVTGATCQIVCYAIKAIELKRRAPRAVSNILLRTSNF